MDADGKNVRRLTDAPGYDGGAFFSPDCSQDRLARLAAARRAPSSTTTGACSRRAWCARASSRSGWPTPTAREARQVTYLGAASFAPSFFPSGERIIFSSNYGDPQRARVRPLGGRTSTAAASSGSPGRPGFDGFPMFSPDGTRLAFSSNRNQGAPGETNVFVARWVEPPQPRRCRRPSRAPPTASPPTSRWLADDAREGRGIGTAGLAEAADWLGRRFATLGLEPAGDDGGFFQRFEVPVAVAWRSRAPRSTHRRRRRRARRLPAGSASRPTGDAVSGEVVAAGYGITARELGVDDYRPRRARQDRRRPPLHPRRAARSPATRRERRYGDLRYKAWNAREHGARGAARRRSAAARRARRRAARRGAAARAARRGVRRRGRRRHPGGRPHPRRRRAASSTAASSARRALAVELGAPDRAGRQRGRRARAGAADRLPRRGAGRRPLRPPRPRRPGLARARTPRAAQRRRRQRLGHRGAARGRPACSPARRGELAARRLLRRLLRRGGGRPRLDRLHPPAARRARRRTTSSPCSTWTWWAACATTS